MGKTHDLTQLKYKSWSPRLADLRRNRRPLLERPNATAVASPVKNPSQPVP